MPNRARPLGHRDVLEKLHYEYPTVFSKPRRTVVVGAAATAAALTVGLGTVPPASAATYNSSNM